MFGSVEPSPATLVRVALNYSSPITHQIPYKKGDIRRYLLFYGVGNGTRTHNARNHNPVLCQLNYTHHIQFAEMARQEGLEPPTYCLEA